MKYAIGIVMTVFVALASCSRGKAAEKITSEIPADVPAIQVSTSAKPWYYDALDGMGFYIFQNPTEIRDFSVVNMKGETVQMSSLKGKVVVLNFWATWCPPCRREMPSLQTLHEKTAGKDIVVMSISVNEKESTVKNFLQKSKYTFPIYLDSDGGVSQLFVKQGIPTTLIVNKEGKAIAEIVGACEFDNPVILNTITELAK